MFDPTYCESRQLFITVVSIILWKEPIQLAKSTLDRSARELATITLGEFNN